MVLDPHFLKVEKIEIETNKHNKSIIIKIQMEHIFRVFDFNVYNETKSAQESSSEDDDIETSSGFKIQIFGCSVTV